MLFLLILPNNSQSNASFTIEHQLLHRTIKSSQPTENNKKRVRDKFKIVIILASVAGLFIILIMIIYCIFKIKNRHTILVTGIDKEEAKDNIRTTHGSKRYSSTNIKSIIGNGSFKTRNNKVILSS